MLSGKENKNEKDFTAWHPLGICWHLPLLSGKKKKPRHPQQHACTFKRLSASDRSSNHFVFGLSAAGSVIVAVTGFMGFSFLAL